VCILTLVYGVYTDVWVEVIAVTGYTALSAPASFGGSAMAAHPGWFNVTLALTGFEAVGIANVWGTSAVKAARAIEAMVDFIFRTWVGEEKEEDLCGEE